MDLLKQLMQDIRKQSRNKRPGIHLKGSSPPRPSKKKTIYSMSENWTPGEVVYLIHESGQGLGYFQEFFHKMSPTARRLLPTKDYNYGKAELVKGNHWLSPHVKRPIPIQYTPHDLATMKARFKELLDG